MSLNRLRHEKLAGDVPQNTPAREGRFTSCFPSLHPFGAAMTMAIIAYVVAVSVFAFLALREPIERAIIRNIEEDNRSLADRQVDYSEQSRARVP